MSKQEEESVPWKARHGTSTTAAPAAAGGDRLNELSPTQSDFSSCCVALLYGSCSGEETAAHRSAQGRVLSLGSSAAKCGAASCLNGRGCGFGLPATPHTQPCSQTFVSHGAEVQAPALRHSWQASPGTPAHVCA
jgi:hypothetical protein